MNTIDREPRSSIRKLQFLGCTAIVLAVGGFGGWGTTTEIAGAVIANGTVVVESNVKKVQHLTGGIIGELRVKEGSEVEAGQVLIRLDDTLTRATLGVVQSQLDLYMAREARLLAERDGLPDIAPPERPVLGGVPEAGGGSVDRGAAVVPVAARGTAGQQSQLRERIAQLREEISGLTAQQQSKGKEIGYITEELSGVEQLYAKNSRIDRAVETIAAGQGASGGRARPADRRYARSRGKIARRSCSSCSLSRISAPMC